MKDMDKLAGYAHIIIYGKEGCNKTAHKTFVFLERFLKAPFPEAAFRSP
jgi:hypothetical protein